jgi:hypothetical protein
VWQPCHSEPGVSNRKARFFFGENGRGGVNARRSALLATIPRLSRPLCTIRHHICCNIYGATWSRQHGGINLLHHMDVM